MYLTAYEEAEAITDKPERIEALKKLSKTISLECKNSSWYDFIRGVTLLYEGKFAKASENIEKAFMKDKNIAFCEKLIQMYSDAGCRDKELEWMKKRDNLRIFERQKIDDEKIEQEQCALKEQLKKHDENQNTLAMQYVKNGIKRKDNRPCLKILKRWSSSTPLLARGIGFNIGNGGGLFIRWKGQGIAIDPGINYILNMAEKGISVLDLDYVIVTHDHIDHNNDLTAIMDIKYQCTSSVGRTSGLSQKETDWVRRGIKYYIDPATEAHFQKDMQENKCDREVFAKGLTKSQLKSLKISPDVELRYFATEHVKNQDTYGIVLELHDGSKSKQIGYTSDTKYLPELCDYFQNADYIIANLSEITTRDLEKREYKHNHMGYQGCYDIVTNPKIYCKYFILSEFWGGKGDIRNIIAKYLKNECLKKKKVIEILPGDINLSFDLTDDSIECSKCGNYCTENNIEIECSGSCIEYVCNKCAAGKP